MFSPAAIPSCDRDLIAVSRGVFDHHHGIGARWRRRTRHDGRRLSGLDFEPRMRCGSGFDFRNHGKGDGNLCQVGGAYRIAISRGSRKRREIAIGQHRLGQNLARAVEQFHQFLASRPQGRGVFLNHMTRLLEAQDGS